MTDEQTGGPTRCATVFVDDIPADVDAFGPHGKIARTLAQTFRSERGGRTVGLAGSYGSGKSTVVKQLEKELESESDFHVWVFDAWAHEGDPLRRTFLESLIGSLVQKDWVAEENWEDDLEELALKRRVTETKTRPVLAPLGVLLGLSVLLTPFGLALLAAGLREGVTLTPTGHLAGKFIVGSVLVLLPVVIALLGGIKAWIDHGSLRKAAEALSTIIIQKGEQDQQTISLETPDRTSLEFETYFMRLMEEVFTVGDKTLILVVDNLDRVQPSDAARIWATLRTFLDHSSSARRAAWIEHLWIVIPYDPEGIRRLWSKPDGEAVANSFLDKAIQVRLDVPPPLLPEWRNYLLGLLAQALPDHALKDWHQLYQVLSVFGVSDKGTPTPRALINAVNAVGALHRYYGHSIPLAHLAYFVALRMAEPKLSTSDLLQRVLDGDIPTRAALHTLPEDVAISLAAVAHSVAPEDAPYLLLGDEIGSSLAEGEADELRSVLNKFPDGWAVVELVLQHRVPEWALGEPEKVLKAADALEGSGLLGNVETHEAQRARQNLLSGASSAEVLAPVGRAADGLQTILGWIEDSELGGAIYRKVLKGAEHEVSQGEDSNLTLAARSLAETQQAFSEAGFKDIVADPIQLPIDFMGLKSLYEALPLPENGAVGIQLTSSEPAESLMKGLEIALSTNEFGPFDVRAVKSLASHHTSFNAETAASKIAAKLNADQAANIVKHAEFALEALLLLWPHSEEPIKRLGQQGHLAHLLHLIQGEEYLTARARAIALYMASVPDLGLPANVQNASHGHNSLNQDLAKAPPELTEELARVLMEEGNPEHLIQSVRTTGGKQALVQKVLGRIAESGDFDDLFTASLIRSEWAHLHKHANIDSLIERCESAEFAEEVMSEPFELSKTPFAAAVLRSRPDDQDLTEWVQTALAGLDTTAWNEHFNSMPENVAELAETLENRAGFRGLGKAYRLALQQYCEGVAGGNEHSEGIEEAVRLLGVDHRAVLRDGLVDMVARHSGDVSSVFFEHFGEEVAAASCLEDDHVLATKVVEPIIADGDESALEWLADYFEAEREEDPLDGPYGRIIKDAVRPRYSEAEEDSREHEALRRIAKVINIRKSPAKD